MASKNMVISASLRIESVLLTAVQIGSLLKSNATKMHEAGDKISPRNPLSKSRDSALWIYSTSIPKEASIEEHLGQLADFVDANFEQLLEIAKRSSMDYFCGLSISDGDGQANIGLQSALMSRLFRIPANFLLSMYYPSTDEEPD